MKLIILGNGFDLHVGLNSTFSNFLKAEYSNDSYIKNFKLNVYQSYLNKIQSNYNAESYIYNLIIDSFKILNGGKKLNVDATSVIDLIDNIKKENFWMNYLEFEKEIFNNELNNWSDIESSIYDFFKYIDNNKNRNNKLKQNYLKYIEIFMEDIILDNINQEKNSDYNSIESDNDIVINDNFIDVSILFKILLISIYILKDDNDVFKFYKKLKSKYSSIPDNKISSYDIKILKKKIITYLEHELNKFEMLFNKYMQDIIHNDKSYDKKSINLFKKIAGNNVCRVLNFNYTTLNSDPLIKSQNNIHGKLVPINSFKGSRNHLIIGVDGTHMNMNDDSYIFTKTFRTINGGNKQNKIFYDNNEIDEICIYGHSLSYADYSYFKNIFDYYGLEELNVKLTICYSTYKDKNGNYIDEDIISRQSLLNLSKLIYNYSGDYSKNNYDFVFDDKSSGDDLLKKLSLNGLIEIKRIV